MNPKMANPFTYRSDCLERPWPVVYLFLRCTWRVKVYRGPLYTLVARYDSFSEQWRT